MNWFLTVLIASQISFSAYAKSSRSKAKAKTFASSVHLKKIDSCDTPDATKTVLILKQWHLPPTTVTKGFKEKYPQEQNQTALYKFVDESVKSKDVQLVVAEGCEGEINSEFATAFNGWDYTSLHAQYSQKSYSKIVSHVPLKIEAKHTDKIETFCGDNEAAIQDGNLRLSNLRGWMGFLSRLSEPNGDSEKVRGYAEAAADLLKVPKDTPTDKVIEQIKLRAKQDVEAFQKSLETRNDSFVKLLTDHEFTKAAVVIGGLHAKDLMLKVKTAGMGCIVYEPPGYRSSDEQLIDDFQKSL